MNRRISRVLQSRIPSDVRKATMEDVIKIECLLKKSAKFNLRLMAFIELLFLSNVRFTVATRLARSDFEFSEDNVTLRAKCIVNDVVEVHKFKLSSAENFRAYFDSIDCKYVFKKEDECNHEALVRLIRPFRAVTKGTELEDLNFYSFRPSVVFQD